MSKGGGMPATRLPQGVEAADQLIKGRGTLDILFLVMLPIGLGGLVFYAKILTIQGFLGWIGGVLVINYILFSIIPTEESIIYWIRSVFGYIRTDKVIQKEEIDREKMDDEIQIDADETGGRDPTEKRTFEILEANETTKEVADVKSVDTQNNVVELESGGFIAGINVTGMERMLADQKIKQKADEKFKGFLNSLDHYIAIRCTSTPFDIEKEIEHYEDRLEDKDVEQRPIFKRHLQSKKQFMQTQIKRLGMNNRQYHIIVAAFPEEQELSEGGPFEIDFIDPDSPIGQWLRSKSGGGGKTQEENLTQMAQKRQKQTMQALTRIRQISTDPMEGEELAHAIRGYWTGDSTNSDGWEPNIPVTVSEQQVDAGEYNV